MAEAEAEQRVPYMNGEPSIIITGPSTSVTYSNGYESTSYDNGPTLNNHNNLQHTNNPRVVDKDLVGKPLPDRPLELHIPNHDDDHDQSRPFQRAHSKSPAARITVMPRGGSFEERESFKMMKYGPQTPQERKKAEQQRSRQGPSSRNTVVTVAGLLIVGLMFILSGLIVLLTDNNAIRPLQITGGVFLSVGVVMLIVCASLQRKNWIRYMDQLDEDLYFLRLGSNPVWKLMKLDVLDLSALGTTHINQSLKVPKRWNPFRRNRNKSEPPPVEDDNNVNMRPTVREETEQVGVVNRAFERGSHDSITKL